MRFRPDLLARMPAWNPLAIVAFAVGAISAYYAPGWVASGLYGLIVSMVVYAALYLVARGLGVRVGHARAAAGD
jgi:hypothetical protein